MVLSIAIYHQQFNEMSLKWLSRLRVEAIEKEAFWLPLTMFANFTVSLNSVLMQN